jgi:hypothetical protein
MPDPAAIIAIVGKPASGKTHCRNVLAEELGWRSLDIADQGLAESGRWPRLLDEVCADETPVVVESCASPERYRGLLSRVPSFVLEVAAPVGVRRRRLSRRWLTKAEQREWLAMSRRPPRRPDLRVVSEGWIDLRPVMMWGTKTVTES